MPLIYLSFDFNLSGLDLKLWGIYMQIIHEIGNRSSTAYTQMLSMTWPMKIICDQAKNARKPRRRKDHSIHSLAGYNWG